MEHHVEGELGCEEREEPLRGVHMSLQTHVQEVVIQVWDVLLLETEKERTRYPKVSINSSSVLLIHRERARHLTCMSRSSWKNLQCRSTKYTYNKKKKP